MTFGILEDVMVRIEQCIFPIDFIGFEMREPDILSRAPTITNWEKGLVVLRVGKESL